MGHLRSRDRLYLLVREEHLFHIRENLNGPGRWVVFHEGALNPWHLFSLGAKKIRVVPQGVTFSDMKRDAAHYRRGSALGRMRSYSLMVSSIRPVKDLGLPSRPFVMERRFEHVKLLLIDLSGIRRICPHPGMGRRLRCFSVSGEKPNRK